MTIQELERHCDINRREAAIFFLYLCMMPPGDSFTVQNGRVEKIDETTLKLVVDEKTISRVAEDFLDEKVEDYDDVFGHLPLS